MKKYLFAAALLVSSMAANAWYCDDGSLIAKHIDQDCSKPLIGSTTPSSSNSSSTANSSSNAGATARQHQAQQQQQGQAQKAVSGSKSNATGGQSTSSSNATGGTSGDSTSNATGGTNSLGSVGNDNSTNSSKFSALALALPVPVFTPPLPMDASDCAETQQSARSGFWNGVSWADSTRNTDKCTLIHLHNAYLDECQYASAKQVKDLLTVKLLPGFKPSDNGMIDMSTETCQDLKKPMPPAPPAVVINAVADAPKVCVPPAPAKQAHKAIKKKCTTCCK